MSLMDRIRSAGQLQTTQPRLGFQADPWWHYRSLLEDGITGKYMVRSLFVQIGVLYLTLWTTASVTGEPATSVSLTLAMPHGRWLQIGHYRQDLSKSQSHMQCNRALPTMVQLPKDMILDTSNPKMWEVRKIWKRRWWHFLTQG